MLTKQDGKIVQENSEEVLIESDVIVDWNPYPCRQIPGSLMSPPGRSRPSRGGLTQFIEL